MGSKSKAFLIGGGIATALFVLLAILTVMAGGSAHADLGGLCCLFGGGGLIGLVVILIYNKGARDAGGSSDAPDDLRMP